jgi:Tol biopolymer transport system component
MDRDRVSLAPSAGLESDRAAFVDALEQGDIGAALALYRGDFLEGFSIGEQVFDSWVDAERTRLNGRFRSALQNGAESALSAGRWLEALQYVQRLTAIAPYDEAAAILEANVLVAAGRTPEALDSLRRFTQALRDQLDLPPSARIREMLSRIERAEPARSPATATRPKETPFFGREAEIARLMSFVRGLSSEQGGTLFIAGPAGIGKSRLVTEFLARARSLGPLLVLRGRERSAGSALPYASVAEALRGALRAPGVAGTGRHLLAEASRILPELRDNFELPEPGPIEAEGGRLRFFEGIAALLDSAAYEQPVCLVLDDMHHASSSTLDLTSYLTGRLRSSPVLMLLLYRDDAEGTSPVIRSRHRGGEVEADDETLTLDPLDRDAVRQLVESIVLARDVAGQLDIDRVADAASGNPLRAIELARRALNGEFPPATPIPLREILWSRLQKASPSQRRVFFAAALLQRRCSLRLLAAAAHLPELATFEAAQELERLGLLVPELDAYVIAHDFTTAFVVEASGLAGRALLAGWAADALASEPMPPGAELAGLYSIAGQQGAAFLHARRAVYDAAAIGSGAEVHRLLALALAVAPDARARGQIEAMLAAFGAGKRLLEPPAPPAATVDRSGEARTMASPSQPAPAPAQPGSPDVEPAPAPTARRRPILTPRLAALVILGTIATAIAVAWRQSVTATSGPRTLRDTLLVVERGNERASDAFGVSGPLADARSNRLVVMPRALAPEWTRSLELPWIRPSVSVAGVVAVERMTDTGTDIYLMSGPGADPIPAVVGSGTDAILGWSPDGRNLLVRRSAALDDGSFDANLWTVPVAEGRAGIAVPIDTTVGRSVEDEAVWSPDGTRIAWVAQTGPAHQRDVFVSRADGSRTINATENPAEDYHISWSSDGNLLGFTSDRDGNPDLFAIDFEPRVPRLWRLTNTPDEEDFASFSPDHRFVAYQSTAGGDAAVYVMPSLGGVPERVTPAGRQFSIAGWRGRPASGYLDRLRIIGPSTARVGDSVALSLFGADPEGNSRIPDSVTVASSDSTIATVSPVATSGNRHSYIATIHRNGSVGITAAVPGWRYDTLTILVGDVGLASSSTGFTTVPGAGRWIEIGIPKPVLKVEGKTTAVYPNADLQWQSGLVSRGVLSLGDSIDLSATFRGRFAGRPIAGALLTMGLVADGVPIDSLAPQLPDYIGVTWDGESSRFTYSVGPQSKSDPQSTIGPEPSHAMRVVVGSGGDVNFYVDGRLRWTSSIRYLGAGTGRRVRIWLGGKATATWGSISDVKVIAR